MKLTKPAKRRRPAPAKVRDRRPGRETARNRRAVLVLGAGRRVRLVRDLVHRLGLACRLETDALSALGRLTPAVRLAIVVPPLGGISAEDFCRRLRERDDGVEVPVLVVGSSPRHSARLYRAGVAGQFDWPAERAALVRAVIRLTGVSSRDRKRATARDAALAARVEERIRADRETFGPLVKVRARRGIVSLGGEVDAAWKISELQRLVSSLPGVDEVIASEVRVPYRGVPDRTISTAVRGLLKSLAHSRALDLHARVSKGRVTLSGVVRSRRELERVVGLIEHVAGVRSIEDRVEVRPGSGDRRSTRMLSRLIRRQFPGSRIDVSVVDDTAVVSGKARNSAERRAIESLVRGQPGVERVVSKVG